MLSFLSLVCDFFLTFIYSLISILPFILSLPFSLFVELFFIYHVILSNSFLRYLSFRFISFHFVFLLPSFLSVCFSSLCLLYVIFRSRFFHFIVLSIYFDFCFDFVFEFFFFLSSFICLLSFSLLPFVYCLPSCEF